MSSIRNSVGKGILYTALAKYSNIVTSVIITAVLARLLTPEEYGTIAIVMVFITFFNYLSDFGIGPAVIQNKELEKKDIESIFSISILIGLLLSVLFYLGAGLISSFYNNPELTNIGRLLAVAIFFSTAKVVPDALNKKDMKFREIGIISVVIQILSGIIAVILALLGFSYFALALRAILNSVLLLAGSFYLNPVKIALKIRWSSMMKIWKFSTFQFMFNFLNYFARNTDNLLVGKFFGPALLGYYSKAFNLMLMPVQNLTHVITPVLHPVLSKFQNRKDKLFSSYLTLTRILATIGFPLSVFLFFSGKEVIYIFYGPQWTESVPVFQLLSLIIGIEMLLSSGGSIFQSANRTDLLLVAGVITSGMIICGVLYGIFIEKSLIGIARGLVVSRALNFFLSYYLLIVKTLGASMRRYFRELIMPLFISGVVLLANILFTRVSLENTYAEFALKLFINFVAFGIGFSCSKRNREQALGLSRDLISRFKMHRFSKAPGIY